MKTKSFNKSFFSCRRGIVLVEMLFLLSLILLILGAVAVQTRMTGKNAMSRLELLERVTIGENYHRYLKIALEEDAKREWAQIWFQELERIALTEEWSSPVEGEGIENPILEIKELNIDVMKKNKDIQRAVKIKVFSQNTDLKRSLLLTSPCLVSSPGTLERIEFQGWEETGDGEGRMINGVQAYNIDPGAFSLLINLYFKDGKGLWRGNSFYRIFLPELSQQTLLDLLKNQEKMQENLLEYSKTIEIQSTGITIKKVR